ncbi:hypothetical protein CVT24_008888 [Panaeolus cyanescens]|uniref:Uncharacterized protein n=1 Tax=Panaeolus cyanescens TaxID=181874 RepID=A0A409VDL7_9AGAR|nr:hypothetical protein CVT24_008888 [Panaeolus cyanescens]
MYVEGAIQRLSPFLVGSITTKRTLSLRGPRNHVALDQNLMIYSFTPHNLTLLERTLSL